MNDLNWRFWAAIIGAVAVKILMSKSLKWSDTILTMTAGVYCGWAFTDLFMSVAKMEQTNSNIIFSAAVVTIAGENILRQLINLSNSESILSDLIKIWRGGGNDKGDKK